MGLKGDRSNVTEEALFDSNLAPPYAHRIVLGTDGIRATTDSMVVCAFKERRSVRDLADVIVRQHPKQFPDRSAVYRKGFHLLIQTLGVGANLRWKAVNELPERCERGTAHDCREGGSGHCGVNEKPRLAAGNKSFENEK
jgi:hypothetical protein